VPPETAPLRIAFVDLTFHWPPSGGCWVDLKEIAAGLMRRGWEVKLFVPVFTDYYPRGHIEGELPFPVEKIHFSKFTFNAYHVRKRMGEAVRAWNPDSVFLGEGYQMKMHLLDHFSKDFPTYCRFYAYEVNCLNLHYWLYDEKRVCDGGFLTDPKRCHRCWNPGFSFPRRLARIAFVKKDRDLQQHFTEEHFTHEYFTTLGFSSWFRKRLPEWLKRAEALIVYNEFTANFFRSFADNVRVIPSGVDTKRFSPPDVEKDRDRLAILLPGRIHDELKGLATVREACRKLKEEGLDFELRVTAPDWYEFEEDWLVNVGWIPQEDLPALYHDADIVIVPSLWIEPFGITTLEAMASGVPVVGAKIGGIAETLVHGETGLHFEPGNVDDLAEALRHLIKSPELRKEFGYWGRRRAVEVYDWDKIIDTHYAEQLELAARAHRASL
jgi:glycosyltransferase involved in cell wall biosynthesis